MRETTGEGVNTGLLAVSILIRPVRVLEDRHLRAAGSGPDPNQDPPSSKHGSPRLTASPTHEGPHGNGASHLLVLLRFCCNDLGGDSSGPS